MNGYELSRKWFDFCFENPEKVTPLHTALYMFSVEHCNRLGWKEKFGLPTEMTKEALGIKSWHTYIKAFNDLVDWNFFTLIQRSKNQYSSNIIALSNFDEALDEAYDKALTKHISKQLQSNDSIIKLITNNLKPITDNYIEFEKFVLGLGKVEGVPPSPTPKKNILTRKNEFKEKCVSVLSNERLKYYTMKEENAKFFDYWSEHGENDLKMRYEKEKSFDIASRLDRWHSKSIAKINQNAIHNPNQETPTAKTLREMEEITMEFVKRTQYEEQSNGI